MSRILRLASVTATTIVLAGFTMFALDQVGDASARTRDQIAGIDRADPSSAQERARETHHSGLRDFADDANDVLLKPFATIVVSADPWVDRTVPTVIALLLYGFGLGFLSRVISVRA